MLALVLAASVAGGRSAEPPPCSGATTPAVEQCLAERLTRAEADLARYVAAAERRLRDETGEDPAAERARRGFAAAERAWAAYRDAECAAVFERWSGGTIRGSQELTCRIRLTLRHTHTVWAEWLTYMDSTPPILPEPAVPPDA